jgi:RHS repeat-associated protein
VKGEGNQQDYGMRIYDPRIGKFLSVDPITAKYPELTPYQFASNTPIRTIDQDGLESAGWELASVKSKLFLQVNNHLSIQSYQMRTILMSMQQTFVQSEACQSCNEERTRAAAHAVRMNTLRTIMGPVGGGGANFGRGMVEDPITKATAGAILAASLSGGALTGASFSTLKGFGTSLIEVNTFKAGMANVAGDIVIQSAQQLGSNGTISFSDFNLTSIAANGIFAHPFTGAFGASAGAFSINDGFSNTPSILGGQKSNLQFGSEVGFGTLFNIASDKSAKFLVPRLGEFKGTFAPEIFGNLISGTATTITDAAIKAGDKKKE